MFPEWVTPPVVILIGAIITAGGALVTGGGIYWQSVRQDSDSKAKGDLLRDTAARSGNKKELEELIKSRSHALNADWAKADDLAASLLKQLPDHAEEFNAMQENKQSEFENRTTDFRLKWEPLINNILNLFDHLVDEVTKAGIKLEKPANGELQLTATEAEGAPTTALRGVISNHVLAQIIYTPIVFRPGGGYTEAQMTFQIQNAQGRSNTFLRLSLGVDSGNCNWYLPEGGSTQNSGNIQVGKDGKIPKEFSDFMQNAFARLFERYLLMSGAYNPDKGK